MNTSERDHGERQLLHDDATTLPALVVVLHGEYTGR